MRELYLIIPETAGEEHPRVDDFLRKLREEPGLTLREIQFAWQLTPIQDRRILFFVRLGASGINLEWVRMLMKIREDSHFFQNCIGTVIVDGESEFYTKSVGRELVLAANLAGCLFPGRCLVEGTGSLYNYRVNAKNWNVGLQEAYRISMKEAVRRLMEFEPPHSKKPKILVLHASVRGTSNTLQLWGMIKSVLKDSMEFQEISLRNGEVHDCGGCPYTMCMHYSERGQCYYGGVIVEQVYPAVAECDGLVMLCPNYNDSISANMVAFINRLTSLYRKRQFFDKYLFSLVVSGYSGGNILAEQLLGSLSMNKTFILPPRFVMMETANDPGSIGQVEGIQDRAEEFALAMKDQLLEPDVTVL
ncbi:MAG: NAD(P)H-dependent oxidoreductase [Clostridiales bacterium]|nr:NAD(P)H-dependent oxidoreductase [Clostridiales bacterium]